MIRCANILVLVCLLIPGTVRAAGISFSAAVDRETISISDRLTYTLTVEGTREGRPDLPDIPGFEMVGSASRTHFSLVNNQTRVIQELSYTLMPLRTGEFTIPSARLVHGGRTYRTRPVRVRVVDGPAPPADPPPPAAPRLPAVTERPEERPEAEEPPALFIITEIDREEAYVNEQITLTLRLYHRPRVDIRDYYRSTTGFIEERLGEQRNFVEVRNGIRYRVMEKRWAIFPSTTGELTIGPTDLKGLFLGRMNFFEFNVWQPFHLRSEPSSVTVRSLPRKGQPDYFRGAVGDFEIRAEADPTAVRAGDPITVTMKIAGEGNLDTGVFPEFLPGEEFRTFSPETETRKTVRDGRLGGEKIFQQVLIPLTEEVREIPAVSFSFFDPGREEYRTVTSPPVPVEVEPAPDRETLLVVEDARRRDEIRLLSRDILYIRSDPGNPRRRGRPYYRRPFFLLSLVALPGFVLAAWAVSARKERLREDIAYARQVGASRSARKRFRAARKFLAAGEGQRFYGEVHRAFNRYLGDKFRLPAGAVSSELIAGKLAEAGADPEIGEKVADCLDTFDRVRFSGAAAGEEEMREFLARVEKLIGRLEKIKVR